MRAGNVLMKSHWFFTLLFTSIFFFFSAALAGIGDWKSYTDMKSVRSVASDGTTIWAATSGGIFQFNPADSTYQRFVNSDGLSTNDVTAIFVDSFGNVWIGQQSGNIDVYNPSKNSWRYITDVLRSGKTKRSINRFFQSGDKMYIATGFGAVVFSISKFEFADTYSQFASIIEPTVTAVQIYQNRVFAATSSGIVASKIGSTNLIAPESWEILSNNSTINNLVEFNSGFYASSAAGMLQFQTNSWNVVAGLATAVRIVSVLDTSLIFIDGSAVRSLDTVNSVSTLNNNIPVAVSSGTMTKQRKIFLGYVSSGIGSWNQTLNWEFYIPNGPNSNSFPQIVVDENGMLWSASGRSNGFGFYSYNGSEWKNYTKANTSLMTSNECFAIEIGPNNSKWISTWGGGLILVDKNNNVVRVFDQNNPGFVGVSENTDFIVPGKAAADRNGNVWVPIFRAADFSKTIWKMTPDSVWVPYGGFPYGSFPDYMFGVVVDPNNTKWFTNTVPTNFSRSATIAFFNESRNITGAQNGWGVITEDDGASDLHTQSIVVDKENDIWIATSQGITIITDINNPKSRVSKIFLNFIADQYINWITIDAQNNKWIATSSKGVFVVSPDGRQLLNQYTVENTNGKLADNNVMSLAFDRKKGVMYFGTDKGLSSIEVAAIETQASFSSIDLSPNPIYLPAHQSVEIRGLVDESTVKILALNGKVISQFPAQGGGRAFWNCRDGEG
ncbi:MAG: two-component regulator propeller domain-containing protein, partial [Bacteroidota bacterium]|nr:two-component regulator propeller domain-containing protein [Bacteroidota bacterium]